MDSKPRTPIQNPELTRPNWLKEAPRDPELLWLDKNENTDPELQKTIQSVLSKLDLVYCWTYPEMAALYQKLAALEGVPAESLLLTAGSDGVIRTVFEAYVSEGDTVVHTNPTFAMYPVYSKIFGAKTITLDYAKTENGPALSLDAILDVLDRACPKLFCLPNPDSPTGTFFEPDAMGAIVKKCESTGTLCLIDEAYYPFYPKTEARRALESRNVVVARTFSKGWGLAGLRCGFSISHKDTNAILNKVRPMYEVNTIAIGFLEKMLDHKDAIQASVSRLNEGKAYFKGEMEKLGFKTLPTQGNFTHVAFGVLQSKVFEAIDSIALYRKDFKGTALEGYSRFSATTVEQFKPLVKRIAATVGSADGSLKGRL